MTITKHYNCQLWIFSCKNIKFVAKSGIKLALMGVKYHKIKILPFFIMNFRILFFRQLNLKKYKPKKSL